MATNHKSKLKSNGNLNQLLKWWWWWWNVCAYHCAQSISQSINESINQSF